MPATLRVLLVGSSDAREHVLQRALALAGHRVVGRSRSAAGLHAQVQRVGPDVIIVDAPTVEPETLANIGALNERAPRALVVFTDDEDPAKIREAVHRGVAAYVVDGFAPERIGAIVHLALARFEQCRALKAERDQAQAKLAERKLIERAKGILMRKRRIGEDEAYHALRRIAMERNLRMSEVAQQLIGMSDLLG